MSVTRSRMLSVGTAVPENIVTNRDLEKILDTSDEWITKRTGISQRRVFPKDAPGGTASELGAKAARQALEKANIDAKDVDAVICATFTPDYFFPSTACLISSSIGCNGAAAFDISAACAGFVYGVSLANSMIVAGQCRTVVVVGTEVISKTLDWTDRTTSILFGDGAGAVVIQATEDPDRGILSSFLTSDGSLGDILKLGAWSGEKQMFMKGSEVFKHAVRMMCDATDKALERCGISRDEVGLLIPHQANLRIIKSVADHINVPMDRVVLNLDRYGNTSAASVPLALAEAWDDGRITDGKCVAFVALGGGLAAASAIVRF